ncbi:beta/gamma crystallin domain-containing protein 1 isoform X1 [Pantherophis guttatus]|uniref:Beta/gamma crystallin domain-containing protein 1 isoform X1 n=2 Tax=Pantherophis guttatus TaxID=94885 RepID=A0ABM3Z9P3_PANGU|nr:beta/gamma crystallin domain-containing protein 1 isoform X1 [Pantherophis guttatus]
MEKGGFKRLGRLFHHRSESEDSEPELGKDTPVSSPCPSPCLEGRREHRGSCSSTTTTTTVSGERKKRSPFGHWRLKKKQQQSKDEEAAGGNAVISSLFASSSDASEPTTPTNSYFDMPDMQYATQEKQQPLVPIQNSQYAYGISVDSISSSTLPSSFRKSKTRSSESSKELKKKAVLGKFGHFFTTGRRKNPKNTQETSSKPSIKIIRPESPHKNLAPLASIEIEDLNDLSKSEESLTDSIYEQNQSKSQDTIDSSEDYLYNRDLTPLYNDIVSEWNTKGLSSGSELSLDWHSSNETIKNTLFDSNLTLGTLEGENELVTDTNTTPDFFKSLSTLSDENLEQIILNHKELVEPLTFAESEYAESKDQPFFVEPKQDEQPQPSRILTLDIFLRRAEQQNLNKPVAVALDDDCSNTDIMDKKPAIRKSGKRRKSQSSSDVPNGDRNASENTGKEEPGFDGIPSDMVSEKISTSERKVRPCQQIMSPANNNDIRSGSNHKGFTKSELEKCKQQSPASSSYKKKSFKKNQSDAGPPSPIGIKSPGKNPSAKRQSDGIMDGNPASKCTSVEELPSDDNIVVSPVGIVSNSSSQLPSEERTESQDLHPVRSSDGRVILQADKHKNDEVEGNGRQISSDLDEAKPRNICLDVSRTVTTKVSLPAKPKNVELNLKASKSLENLANDQDATDKVKINFSIANKISMFESKQNNQHQSADAPASKRGSVSNTFVGRAKLKFGRQQTESEQTNKITNKGNHRQKLLQNGTKVKEISSDTNIKAQRKIEANSTCDDVKKSEELGKIVKCQVNENDKVDGTKVNDSTFTKIDTELVKDKDLDNVSSIVQNEEIEINNWSMNATSLSPESEETFSLSSDHYFPNNNDKSLPQPDPTPQTSELNQISQFENKDQKVINTVLEDNQEFEQNNSWQENQSSGCNVSESSSTDGICDSPSDMAKFTETLKNLDSSVCIPQKKKKQKLPKSPAPHFAMPPIHEDKLEKIFDPNIFTVGLGIKRDRSQDLTPSVQLKLQSLETDARIRPKRASAENSLLLQSLKLPSRADSALMQEMNGKENKDSTDSDIKRSRLENSAIFSSLLAPTTKEKMFTPSVTTVNTITTSFASQKNATSSGIPPSIFDVTQKSEPLPGFKAPNYMDKYLQTDDAKRERILQMPNFGSLENSFSNWLKPGQCESNEFLAFETFSGKNQNKTNPRPGKVMICNKSDASENSFEVFHDVLDCTSWKLSPVILVKVIRGCWILYEKPNFEGVSIPMEEGELEFSNLWGEEAFDSEDTCKDPEPIVIGSIRHVVKDYRICRIDLFTEPQGLGLVNAYFDDTEETRLGSSQKTCSIQVSWGIWLLYEEPGYQGIPLMLEPGEYPDLSCWEKKEAYIRSLKPLKMGGRKVEYPKSRKVIVYEKPFFEGKHIELDSELTALAKEGDRTEESEELENELLTSIGSIKVKAGIWVAYEKPEFEGHQYLLEEGEYQEWTDWGGYDEQLQSLRPVLGDLMHPHMIMYTEKDFGNKGSSINVLGIISNLKDTGYGLRTQSVNVISGVWVAYENPDFTGEQYILDKGMYPSCEAWGAKNNKISSVQPILLDIINDHVGKFKVQLFSEPEFQGSSQILEKDVSQIAEFPAKSSKVLSGSWIAYDKENFSGNQYVLEEGAYPDLSAMGCLPQTCLKSLQVINIELSEPVITLFEKENFKGKKFEFITEIVNLQFLGYNPHIASVEVHGGIWIIYEHHNYKGRQILLTPKKISNWKETSSYHKIGSLRPLLQKQVYFRLRNKETGKFMAADGNMDDLSLLRIQAVEDNKSGDQIWLYQDGFIKCRGAEDICLTIVGNLITPGTKLGLALQQNDEKQNWSFHSDGKIYSKMKPNLVLDIKEGKQYDQNHLILSTVSEDRPTQCWEPLII